LDEKVQVERCVNEMVSWVAEQHMLNDNADKMNELGIKIAAT